MIKIDFARYSENSFSLLMKHLFAYSLKNGKSITTATQRVLNLYVLDKDDINSFLTCRPQFIKAKWQQLRSKYSDRHKSFFDSIKSIFRFYGYYNLFGWSQDHDRFIASVLFSPSNDKYSTVRSGDAFLSVHEEAAIVQHLDDLVASVKMNPANVDNDHLHDNCMLLCAYQFAMRTLQIAKLKNRDVRIWHDSEHGYPAVHLTFEMIKQRNPSACLPLLRRIKRDWSPLFTELMYRLSLNNPDGNDRIFNISKSSEVGVRIKNLASAIVGRNITATSLRHTAAQRLVDGGASQEELTEFLGHSVIDTCLIYFRNSPNQAEQVNRALCDSKIYHEVMKIAHNKFVLPEDLSALKGDQQIAGIPYGIPITGIGMCMSGQPSCHLNPVTSCYLCNKFIPVNDIGLHKRVYSDFKSVVKEFYDVSREEVQPAYLQLERTLESIASIIAELEKDGVKI